MSVSTSRLSSNPFRFLKFSFSAIPNNASNRRSKKVSHPKEYNEMFKS